MEHRRGSCLSPVVCRLLGNVQTVVDISDPQVAQSGLASPLCSREAVR